MFNLCYSFQEFRNTNINTRLSSTSSIEIDFCTFCFFDLGLNCGCIHCSGINSDVIFTNNMLYSNTRGAETSGIYASTKSILMKFNCFSSISAIHESGYRGGVCMYVLNTEKSIIYDISLNKCGGSSLSDHCPVYIQNTILELGNTNISKCTCPSYLSFLSGILVYSCGYASLNHSLFCDLCYSSPLGAYSSNSFYKSLSFINNTCDSFGIILYTITSTFNKCYFGNNIGAISRSHSSGISPSLFTQCYYSLNIDSVVNIPSCYHESCYFSILHYTYSIGQYKTALCQNDIYVASIIDSHRSLSLIKYFWIFLLNE